MGDLSKRLREVERMPEFTTPRGGVVIREDHWAAVKALIAEAADALEWQPIADAPRDVPLLLLLPNQQTPCIFTIHQTPSGEAYIWIGTSRIFKPETVFTHFMPLPQPPEGE